MNNYYEVLKTVKLFEGIDEKDLSVLLPCLGAKIISVDKDEFVLIQGDKVEYIGIVLSGCVHIVKENKDGVRTVIAAVDKGGFFAEAICCTGTVESPVSVISDVASEVMIIRYGRLLHTCSSSCLFHTKLIENMIFVIAEKNLMLQKRMDIISQKTLRMKIAMYLESFSAELGVNIKIPFNREQLAEYLCVDRSALSHELARMKKDGFLDYHKNNFKLLK